MPSTDVFEEDTSEDQKSRVNEVLECSLSGESEDDRDAALPKGGFASGEDEDKGLASSSTNDHQDVSGDIPIALPTAHSLLVHSAGEYTGSLDTATVVSLSDTVLSNDSWILVGIEAWTLKFLGQNHNWGDQHFLRLHTGIDRSLFYLRRLNPMLLYASLVLLSGILWVLIRDRCLQVNLPPPPDKSPKHPVWEWALQRTQS